MKKLMSLLAVLVSSLSLSGCQFVAQPDVVYEEPAAIIVEADDNETDYNETGDNVYTAEENETEILFESDDVLAADGETVVAESETSDEKSSVDENGSYNTKDEVALYIHTYGKLPSNYITKKEAEALGWSGGSLEPYAPGKSIGGGKFGNYEGLLPDAKGRKYTECDIDTAGKSKRGSKRIVFSNDGLIYYTEDHYETFELLYE